MNINYFKKVAKRIKKSLEAERAETWNVIIGTDFGSFCSFEKYNVIYFRLNEIYFLMFRFGSNN